MGVTLTYAELERHSAAFAGYLQAHTDLVPGIASRCRCPTSCITRSPCSVPCAPG
jgi:acyl-CoA synthetase (AMP-forming)/AMP-acid ligase II